MNQQNHSRHQILQSVPQAGHIMHIYDHAHMCTIRLFSFLLVIASTGEGLWGKHYIKNKREVFTSPQLWAAVPFFRCSPAALQFVELSLKKKKKSIRRVSINLPSGALILPLNWVNRIVYLKGRTL